MTDPLVSVVIPTYKRAAFIRHAVENVLRQTYQNIEVLVVDDGSPDDTSAVVQSIPDTRVRLIRHAANRGVSAARNSGIKAVRGMLIGFMDDDDEWREDKIEKQLQAIQGFDAVACTAVSNSRGYSMRVHKRPRITLEDLKRGSFAPSGLMAKAFVFRDLMFDETVTQGEDWDVFIRIAQRYSIAWISAPLLIYNEGAHTRTTTEAKSLFGAALERRAAVVYKHREFLGERWFKYHLADTFLSYIGSRPNKAQAILYAIRRSGLRAVTAVLADRALRKLRRNIEIALVHPMPPLLQRDRL